MQIARIVLPVRVAILALLWRQCRRRMMGGTRMDVPLDGFSGIVTAITTASGSQHDYSGHASTSKEGSAS